MIKANGSKSKVALTGVYCLPTSSKAHIHEPQRSTAFKAGQTLYLLRAKLSAEEGGYPQLVVLAADEPIPGFELDADVETQHAQVRKNLPPRFVQAIVQPDGTVEGDASLAPKGFSVAHWEFIPTNEDGSANLAAINGVMERIERTKQAAKDAKDAVRAAKSKKTAA